MATPESYGKVKLKGMILGDDNWATVLDEQPVYKNKRGVEMKRYLIIPGDHLLKQYPELQKPGALEHKGFATWVEFPTYWIEDNNPSRTNAIVRISCGFDGRRTWLTDKDKHFTDEIKTLQEEKENLELSNLYLTEEQKKLLDDKKILIKDLAEISNMNPGGRRDYGEYGEQERSGEQK